MPATTPTKAEPIFFTDEEIAQHQRDHNAMLVDRYQRGLPMPHLDKAEARRLIRAAKAFEKQAKQ